MALITRLFVGNLPENFNENALKNAFSSYGEITNFDLKCKPGLESDNRKRFAFVTISASNFNVESCIKYFSNEDFHGNRLYVTRARESFLERLQREREQSQNKSDEKNPEVNLPMKKKNNGEHHNIHKRKFDEEDSNDSKHIKKSKGKPVHEMVHAVFIEPTINQINHTSYEKQLNNTFHDKQNKKSEYSNKKNDNMFQNDEKKQNSDKKRQDSMKKKKQEFNEKKNIIKTGLVSIDKQSNKKIIFSDTEENSTVQENSTVNGHIKQNNMKSALFDDGGSDDEINFEVKKQFEGKKGQKVLDLQSRYKSDKRFVLDERFVEESDSEKDEGEMEQEKVDLNQVDEKSKQLNILQDLLGVTIKSKSTDTTNKTKPKLGMLRFDPAQPDHAKYLVPVTVQEQVKKSKKKKGKETKEDESHKEPENVEKVEVSKEQFYKISDTLKETMTQPTTFSLRSLFRKDDDEQQQEGTTEDVNYIPLQTKKDTKVKNPLDPGEKNPFQYDSSESENEEDTNAKDTMKLAPETIEIKTVWREKLFLTKTDPRLKDGLIFFGKSYENEGQKDRRELKSLMKKRINNKERKNTMFQKKIGGRKKTIRKKYRKN